MVSTRLSTHLPHSACQRIRFWHIHGRTTLEPDAIDLEAFDLVSATARRPRQDPSDPVRSQVSPRLR